MQTTNKKGTMKATDLPATGRTRPRMSERINLRLPTPMRWQLHDMAYKRQITIADVVREIIQRAIKGER